MKRDDDSHSMSNSQFEVVSVAEYLKLLTVIFMIWFIFACLSVWVLKSRPIRASLISTASGSWVLEINKSRRKLMAGGGLGLIALGAGPALYVCVSVRWNEELRSCGQAVGQATVGPRERSSPDRARCRQPGQREMWMNLSLSVNQWEPVMGAVNQSERGMTGTRPAAFGPQSGTRRGQNNILQTTYSNSVHTFTRLSPSVATTRASRAPRAPRCAWCQSVQMKHSRR